MYLNYNPKSRELFLEVVFKVYLLKAVTVEDVDM